LRHTDRVRIGLDQRKVELNRQSRHAKTKVAESEHEEDRCWAPAFERAGTLA